MFERREADRDPTTRIRQQMVAEHRTPLPRPKSLSGLGHLYAHVSDVNLGRNIDVDLHRCLQNDTSMFCETSARNIDASMFSTHSVIFR